MMLKKIIYIGLGIVLIVIAAVFVINLLDESLKPGVYTMADLPPASFDAENGFYMMWGLAEPEAVDVQSEEYTKPFRELFDPALKDKGLREVIDVNSYRANFKTYADAVRMVRYPRTFETDWITALNPQLEKLEEARQTCALLLKRYRNMLNSPKVEDFTYPDVASPIPNLLALLLTAKLYTAVSTTKAVGGQWQEGVKDLLTQINFARRFIPNSRILIVNLIAKAVLSISLQGVNSILNHPQCPEAVYLQVIDGFTPLKYREYGNRNCFISESLCFNELLDDVSEGVAHKTSDGIPGDWGFLGQLLLQTNATKNYFYDFYSRAIAFDEQEPYLWKSNPLTVLREMVEAKTRGLTWRIKNPIGKIMFAAAVPNIGVTIFKSYQLRCRFEMVRILAEFQLKYSTGKKIADVLQQLESYKMHDPGSGKPYKWNEKKSVLYSIGVDGVDGGGIERIGTTETDIAIPVVIKR